MEGFGGLRIEDLKDEKPLPEDAREARNWAYVHSVEIGSAVDGPGMRYLLFLAGCAFRCLYCHNPDTWKANKNQRRDLEDVLADIGKYAQFLRYAGGLTVSGGEPLTQARVLGKLFAEVKARYSLHTALDTQGYLAGRLPDSWFDPVDLVLLDIKHIDPEKHVALTAYPLRPTLDFAERLARLGKAMWIRHVVVPGWTDDPEEIKRLADYVAGLSTVQRVELLPFHQLGKHKWKELGLEYKLENTATPDEDFMEELREIFRERGIDTY